MAVQRTLRNARTYLCYKHVNASPSRSTIILLASYVLVGIVTNITDAAAVATASGSFSSSAASSSSSSSTSSSSSSSNTLSSRTVRTKYGDVSGVIVTFDSRHLEPVEVFRGIPYASPPTGNLRFMPPVTGALWSGVKVADHFGPVCPQKLPDISNETLALKRMPKGRVEYLKRLLPYLQNQSEDCLYLNIYAPAQAGTRESGGLSRYPVLVYVHGESYEWNSGNPYDGSVLASYGGVVVVTINYRLGILGFLNANTDAYLRSPANYGLMDQIAALHWLQENIAVFGGDPTNVTIIGHGTGAACINFLMTSSAVPDGLLFHRAVLMSGSGLSPWALVENPARYAQQVARHANCSPDLPQPHLLKCLRERPLDALLATPIGAPEFSSAFGPSIDGVVIDNGEPPSGGGSGPSGNADISSRYGDYVGGSGSPGSSSSSGSSGNSDINTLNSVLLRKSVVSKLSRYDLLLGVVKAEAYFAFSGEDVQYGIEADRRSRILRTFVRNTYRYHLSEILATIVNEYTDWERPVQHPINIRDETLEALSDAQVVAPVVHTADLHSAARRNSYLYVFDYQTKFGDYPQRQGCIHGEELPYVFGAPLVGGLSHFPRNYTKSEMLLSEATMIYWSNFARTGNPNEPQEPDLVHGVRQERNRFKNIEWTAYEAVHKKYLNLDTKPKVKTHYRAHRLSFWLNLVPDLHRPGGDDVPLSHHMLEDGNDHAIGPGGGDVNFEGRVRLPGLSDGAPLSKKPAAEATSTSSSAVQAGGKADPASVNTSGNTVVTSQSLLPSDSDRNVDDATSAAAAASASPPQQQEDGFAAYSTALSVTIAIGCSLLILNVLIFAGVYYQRDKSRLHQEGGGQGAVGKKRAENGQMPNSICGDLLAVDGGGGGSTTNVKGTDPGGGGGAILGHHHHHSHHHHQLPPPEFADLPPPPPSNNSSSGTSTLPRPPPPPKTPKPPIPALSNPNQLQSCGPESQPSLPPHNMQILNAGPGSGGTLTKKGGSHNNKMEELRV